MSRRPKKKAEPVPRGPLYRRKGPLPSDVWEVCHEADQVIKKQLAYSKSDTWLMVDCGGLFERLFRKLNDQLWKAMNSRMPPEEVLKVAIKVRTEAMSLRGTMDDQLEHWRKS